MTELIDNKQQRLDKLLQAIVKDVERFLKKHSKKEFYAFAFDCSKDVGEILWAFNTEKALASTIKYYKKNADEDEAALYDDPNSEDCLSLRYGIGDWNYTTQSKAHYIFGDGDKCLAVSDKAEELDPENGVEQFEQEVMNFFEELLLAFCLTETYKAIPKTQDFKILFSEHNDNAIDDTFPRSEAFMQRLNGLIDEKLDYQFPKIPDEARTVLSEIDKQLFTAVRQGDNKEVKRLLENGANVNAVEHGEFKATLTPLHIAVKENNLECVRLLIEHGANVNAKDSKVGGDYPLWYASPYRGEIMRLLLDNGADVNKAKALHCAIYRGETEIAEMLLSEYQADPNVGDILTGTALSGALIKCAENEAFIQMLLDYGADPNLNSHDKIPIFIAVRSGLVKIVQLLIEHGANVNAVETYQGKPSANSRTPLMILMYCYDGGICDNDNHLEIARLLINAGADVNAKDKKGNTVLDYLPQSSRLMRQLLEEHGAKA